MAELVYDTKTERYESARVERLPFDQAVALLTSNNLRLISGELNAQLRIALGPHAPLSQTGNYITQGIIRASPNDVYLPQASPVLARAEQATEAHRSNKPFLLSKQDLKKALEGATPSLVSASRLMNLETILQGNTSLAHQQALMVPSCRHIFLPEE